jgi:hypothetical protein
MQYKRRAFDLMSGSTCSETSEYAAKEGSALRPSQVITSSSDSIPRKELSDLWKLLNLLLKMPALRRLRSYDFGEKTAASQLLSKRKSFATMEAKLVSSCRHLPTCFVRSRAAGFSFSLKTSSLSILDYRRCVAARLAVRKSFLRYLERGF